MDVNACQLPLSPYSLFLKALSLVPIHHYLCCLFLLSLIFLYNFLEFHFLADFLSGFRGDPVSLTYRPGSRLYQSVAAKCRVLHGRYSPTPWLSSPHLITAYLSKIAKAPDATYRREIFRASDGGTIALDWLMHSDVKGGVSSVNDAEKTPITVVVPGLTSDSASAYIKHLALRIAKGGWNVVVCNHRGLGGVSITSDCFYNGGWTEDIRKIIDHISGRFPEAPLYAVGASLGANMLVKYLGEDGDKSPLIGAAAVCSPWDLLMCDRYINRMPVQKFYDRVLAGGLKAYAQLHQSTMSRLTNWDSVTKARSIRDFDSHATRILAKFETVDAFYRRSSCVNFICNVSVPLLGISALDDPVCTKEAIPWDECRTNGNIILATTKHGGHLAYHEGITANSLWWVRAVDEFFHALDCSPLRNRLKKMDSLRVAVPQGSSIDQQGPYLSVTKDAMVAAVSSCGEENLEEDIKEDGIPTSKTSKNNDMTPDEAQSETELKEPSNGNLKLKDLIFPDERTLDQLSRHCRNSFWLGAYIALVTTLPLLGPSLTVFLQQKMRKLRIPNFLLKK
ncbi:hypothetical protein Tsubulata_001053 [Turnera subulata]|uniref:Serine aminopeptidase S33 domain-containing protein n=1 Tax=Turnera subulata TaxID=218843 RepID=A0A9Q0FKI1_9ROSI|nr:hypothetical protein Tsubulata_001053 [Turnera subulata]